MAKKKKKKEIDLLKKAKKVKGRIHVLRALPYRGHMVYLRIIDEDIFEWLVSYKNEVYAGYNIIKPKKGDKKLTEQEKIQAASLTLQGALATLDMKLGIKPGKKEKAMVKAFKEAQKAKEAAKKKKAEKLPN